MTTKRQDHILACLGQTGASSREELARCLDKRGQAQQTGSCFLQQKGSTPQTFATQPFRSRTISSKRSSDAAIQTIIR